MWTIFLGLAVFFAGVFLLLALLSPRGEARPLIFTCQRCGEGFSSPPVHPLPERYQEEDLSLCDSCSGLLEDRVRDTVRRELADFVAPAPHHMKKPARQPD